MCISNKTRNVLIIFMMVFINFSVANDIVDDDDDSFSQLIFDIVIAVMSGVAGACSESSECAIIMWPSIIVIMIVLIIANCECESNDYSSRKSHIRFRTLGAGVAGYCSGKAYATS